MPRFVCQCWRCAEDLPVAWFWCLMWKGDGVKASSLMGLMMMMRNFGPLGHFVLRGYEGWNGLV